MNIISTNIKLARENAHKTLKSTAEYLNINMRTYQNYEAGVSDIPAYMIPKLADFFNVDIFFLLNEKEGTSIVQTYNENSIKEPNSHPYNAGNAVVSATDIINELKYIIEVQKNIIESLKQENQELIDKLNKEG